MSERNIFTRGLTPSYSSRGDEKIKSVLDAGSSPASKEDAPSWKVTRDSQGNYYVNGTKAPWMRPPINPYAVPTVDPTSSSSGMDTISQMYTSPKQEEELRKASVNKQRILALGDALRHIGNIYNTTRYAPAQIFNNPVNEERGRYLQEKAIRDANNYKYQTYQQAKAAQEAKIRQAERDYAFKVAKDQRDYGLAKAKADAYVATQKENQGLISKRGEKVDADINYRNEKTAYIPKEYELKRRNVESQIAKRASTGGGSRGGSRAGSGGGKYWVYDEEGNIHYYPNRTMWEQGVRQYGANLEQTYSTQSVSSEGETRTTTRKRSAADVAGQLAREAANGKAPKRESILNRVVNRTKSEREKLTKRAQSAPKSAPPRATVSAGTKPSTGNAPKKKKGDFSGFSIYDN